MKTKKSRRYYVVSLVPSQSLADYTPRISVFASFGSVLDLGGTRERYEIFVDGEAADARALASDWQIVGQDLLTAAEIERRRQAEEALPEQRAM